MQKLAVALTTQEEFNEYMNILKEKYWRLIFPYANWAIFGENTCYTFKNWNHYVKRLQHYIDCGYKIISLSEAIGDKEIIREEIRGFEHKELGWKAEEVPDTRQWQKTWFVELPYWEGGKERWRYFIKEELLALWFEPIEEPKRDWIDEVWDDYCQTKWKTYLEKKALFKKAIEKHMPQTQTVTMDELLSTESLFHTTTVKGEALLWLWEVVKLLKHKGLLKE